MRQKRHRWGVNGDVVDRVVILVKIHAEALVKILATLCVIIVAKVIVEIHAKQVAKTLAKVIVNIRAAAVALIAVTINVYVLYFNRFA